MTNETQSSSSKTELETRERIKKRVLQLERYNIIQREFTAPEMEEKIKRIIEEEVGR